MCDVSCANSCGYRPIPSSTCGALDVIRPEGSTDLSRAFRVDRELIREAVEERGHAAVRAMQTETEGFANIAYPIDFTLQIKFSIFNPTLVR